MNHSTHIVVAVISLACGAFLMQPVASDTDVRHVIAKVDAIDAHGAAAVDSQTFAEYAGRYEIEGGAAFIIDDDGEFLSIELPETWGGARMHLHARGAGDFSTEAFVSVRFLVGSDGRVSGLLFYPGRARSRGSHEDFSPRNRDDPRRPDPGAGERTPGVGPRLLMKITAAWCTSVFARRPLA